MSLILGNDLGDLSEDQAYDLLDFFRVESLANRRVACQVREQDGNVSSFSIEIPDGRRFPMFIESLAALPAEPEFSRIGKMARGADRHQVDATPPAELPVFRIEELASMALHGPAPKVSPLSV